VTEADVLRLVSDWLSLQGFHVERRNVGAIRAGSRFVRFSRPGQADLYGWHRETGRHIEVEVKAPGKRPTPQQMAWLKVARSQGCISFWADSLEECQAVLREQLP